MPEGLEAELYRRAAERAVGRTITEVAVDDHQQFAWEIETHLPGRTFSAARRHGKLVMLDIEPGPPDTLGLHFGMTGRLVVDDQAPIDQLEYGSTRDDAAWDRLVVTFADGGALRINDPRRWATFVLDPSDSRLGPDFFDVTVEQLVSAFARRRVAVKAVLLDQSVVAGFGNMIVDEILWQSGISPLVPARDLPVAAIERFVRTARRRLPGMLRRGGSHRGTITPEIRASCPPCPRDGAPLRREQVGGRTTIWCPAHQIAE